MKIKDPIYPWRKSSVRIFLLPCLVLLSMTISTRAQNATTNETAVDGEAAVALPSPTPIPVCSRTIKANVVALDQILMFNRLGTVNPNGMIYALKQDVVAIDSAKGLVAGNVRLRKDKRPRPIVLRMNSGDCLRITFQNLLSPSPLSDQPATRSAGIHVIGMELVGGISSDGSNVGNNAPSLVAPGGSTVYTTSTLMQRKLIDRKQPNFNVTQRVSQSSVPCAVRERLQPIRPVDLAAQ